MNGIGLVLGMNVAHLVVKVDRVEKETLEKDTIQELKDRQNLKAKKKKDSSKLDKFLKKLGVEEPEKKKPEFEIDQ